MLLFLDTEYTGLGQEAPRLISLALVAEDGSREWYAELAEGWTVDDCAEFVKREVLPHLTGPRLTLAEARASLRDWMASAPRRCVAACDAARDFQFLLELLGECPDNLEPTRFDLAPLIDTNAYHRAVENYHVTYDRPWHHALYDARSYRLGWLASQSDHMRRASR
ncbi:hypothetical protein JFK97_19060 [Chromobacterium phragmitis]|uniref:hypothetical protein n=1 Tax=Chromobacterium amazonense TaxID=1382803 RepID=UPI0021B8270C|nr:hypothetical protein [Chromobacterium amazonense]MBM2886493.1 hypothetical protein [Chromobacterium amazonense]